MWIKSAFHKIRFSILPYIIVINLCFHLGCGLCHRSLPANIFRGSLRFQRYQSLVRLRASFSPRQPQHDTVIPSILIFWVATQSPFSHQLIWPPSLCFHNSSPHLLPFYRLPFLMFPCFGGIPLWRTEVSLQWESSVVWVSESRLLLDSMSKMQIRFGFISVDKKKRKWKSDAVLEEMNAEVEIFSYSHGHL